MPMSSTGAQRLLSCIAVIDARSDLFTGTIMENLLSGAADEDISRAITLCQRLGLHNDIMNQRQGYDTSIKSHRSALSAYLRFGLCIARASLTGASVVILNDVPVLIELMPLLLQLRESSIVVMLGSPADLAGMQQFCHDALAYTDLHHFTARFGRTVSSTHLHDDQHSGVTPTLMVKSQTSLPSDLMISGMYDGSAEDLDADAAGPKRAGCTSPSQSSVLQV